MLIKDLKAALKLIPKATRKQYKIRVNNKSILLSTKEGFNSMPICDLIKVSNDEITYTFYGKQGLITIWKNKTIMHSQIFQRY